MRQVKREAQDAYFKIRDDAFDPKNIRMMASVENVEVGIRLVKQGAEFMGAGIAVATGNHLYKEIGEVLVDKLWGYMTEKFSGKSVVEVQSTLYGPDNKPIKSIQVKR